MKGNWLREQVGKEYSEFLSVGVDEYVACLGDQRTWSTGQMSHLDFVRRILRSQCPAPIGRVSS